MLNSERIRWFPLIFLCRNCRYLVDGVPSGPRLTLYFTLRLALAQVYRRRPFYASTNRPWLGRLGLVGRALGIGTSRRWSSHRDRNRCSVLVPALLSSGVCCAGSGVLCTSACLCPAGPGCSTGLHGSRRSGAIASDCSPAQSVIAFSTTTRS
jgi:hypothetical protein